MAEPTGSSAPREEPADPELRALHRQFDAAVAAGDAGLGSLIRRLARRAREVAEPDPTMALFDRYLPHAQPKVRTRLLIDKASLHGFRNEMRERVRYLQEAARAARSLGDEASLCEALLLLSIPVESPIPLNEMYKLARDGFRLATRLKDRRLAAIGAVNVAELQRSVGERPSTRLRRYLEDFSRRATAPEDVSTSLMVWSNWAAQALLGGDHAEVGRALTEATRTSVGHPGSDLPPIRMILLWRTGRWDEAAAVGDRAIARQLGASEAASVTAVRTAIAIQRTPSPEGRDLERHANLFGPVDIVGAALVQSVLTDLRALRREPAAVRGAVDLIEACRRVGMRAGWEDVMVSLAGADRRAYANSRQAVGDALPVGRRGTAMCMLADVLASEVPADPAAVEDLAEELLSLEEPFPAARALAEAAAARKALGYGVQDLRRRAATIFRDLGADRALAALLRSAGWPHDLAGFQVPASQFKRPSPGLTKRELEVASLARSGFTNREIAEQLSISPETAATHLKSAKRKLGVHRKSELVRLAEAP